jgi:hypothetical protein
LRCIFIILICDDCFLLPIELFVFCVLIASVFMTAVAFWEHWPTLVAPLRGMFEPMMIYPCAFIWL